MAIGEINEIYFNNNPTIPLDPNNNFTSDELTASEANNTVSTYALNQRIKKGKKKGKIVITLSVSIFTGAVSLSNSILGADPLINNFDNSYAIEGHKFSYNFDIKIENAVLKMNILYADSIVYSVDFKKSGTFKDDVFFEKKGSYTAKFYSTNLFDYEKELTKYSFNFEI